MNYRVHIVVASMVQDFQERSNRIDKVIATLGCFSCLSYYFRIDIQVNSILHFIPLCCIILITSLYISLGLVRFLLILGCSLIASFVINFYTIYTIYLLSWGDLIYYEYLIFMNGNLVGMVQHLWPVAISVSGFFIFPHRIIIDQTWLLINKNKSRNEVIIIILYSKL